MASRVDMAEKHIIRYIIEGLRDPNPSIALLYSATTIADLKALSHRYVQREMYAPTFD